MYTWLIWLRCYPYLVDSWPQLFPPWQRPSGLGLPVHRGSLASPDEVSWDLAWLWGWINVDQPRDGMWTAGLQVFDPHSHIAKWNTKEMCSSVDLVPPKSGGFENDFLSGTRVPHPQGSQQSAAVLTPPEWWFHQRGFDSPPAHALQRTALLQFTCDSRIEKDGNMWLFHTYFFRENVLKPWYITLMLVANRCSWWFWNRDFKAKLPKSGFKTIHRSQSCPSRFR